MSSYDTPYNSPESYQNVIKNPAFGFDNVRGIWHTFRVAKMTTKIKNKGSKMENTITVGSQFTTRKSGVVGTVQEVVKNATGSLRVRLDVNGQPRWTTVK